MKNIAQHLEDFRKFNDDMKPGDTIKCYPIQDWMGLTNTLLYLKCIGKNRYISDTGHVILTGFSPTGGQLFLRSQEEFDNLCDIFDNDEPCLIYLSCVEGTTGDISIIFLKQDEIDFLYNNNLTNKEIRSRFNYQFNYKHYVYFDDNYYKLDSYEVCNKMLSHNRDIKLSILLNK